MLIASDSSIQAKPKYHYPFNVSSLGIRLIPIALSFLPLTALQVMAKIGAALQIRNVLYMAM
jgi:hypothetical protein